MVQDKRVADAPAIEQVPLCVDMDGTLVRTDTLVESAFTLFRERPWMIFAAPLWALRGKAAFKHEIARRTSVDAASLPYNQELLSWLKRERASGRKLLLVTGAEREIAEPVADYLCLFDAVISSGEDINMTGAAKRDELTGRFGSRGFDYVGNAYPDLKVFRESRAAVLVNASDSLVRDASKVCSIQQVFPRRSVTWASALSSLRIHQWVKNVLVFVPVLTSHNLLNANIVLRSILMCFAFSLCSSGIYILNDLIDMEADRKHPIKKLRPFASGELSMQWGLLRAPLLILAALGAGLCISFGALAVLAIYCSVAMLYSITLKRRVLVDVFTLSILYTTRIWAGHAATGIPLSPWLLSFSMFLFLSLAFSKRVSELRAFERTTTDGPIGRGYRIDDTIQLTIFGVSSGFIASLVLSLYIDSSNVMVLYQRPVVLWALCPIVLYWICRVWILAHRGEMNQDPIAFAIRDRLTYGLALLAGVVLLLATESWLPPMQTTF